MTTTSEGHVLQLLGQAEASIMNQEAGNDERQDHQRPALDQFSRSNAKQIVLHSLCETVVALVPGHRQYHQ